jgi:hypothetical protein
VAGEERPKPEDVRAMMNRSSNYSLPRTIAALALWLGGNQEKHAGRSIEGEEHVGRSIEGEDARCWAAMRERKQECQFRGIDVNSYVFHLVGTRHRTSYNVERRE